MQLCTKHYGEHIDGFVYRFGDVWKYKSHLITLSVSTIWKETPTFSERVSVFLSQDSDTVHGERFQNCNAYQ